MEIKIDTANLLQTLECGEQSLVTVQKGISQINENLPLIADLASRHRVLAEKLRQEKMLLLDALIDLAKKLGLMQFSVGKVSFSTDPKVARIYLSYKGREARPRSYGQLLDNLSNSEFCFLCEDMAGQIQYAIESHKTNLSSNQDILHLVRGVWKNLSAAVQDI